MGVPLEYLIYSKIAGDIFIGLALYRYVYKFITYNIVVGITILINIKFQ